MSMLSAAQRLPVLYPILDAELVFRSHPNENRWALLRRLLRELAAAGVEMLQYRNKRDEDLIVTQDALAMREAAPFIRLILNDRPELVLPVGWNGVHVGQDDMPAAAARSLVGRRAIVGLSTHYDEQVIAADAQPVDYIAVGPVFATASKFDTSPVIGVEGVMRARSLTSKPLVAIGGITTENAASIYDAGADSIAVISAIFGPGKHPVQSVGDFLQIFK